MSESADLSKKSQSYPFVITAISAICLVCGMLSQTEPLFAKSEVVTANQCSVRNTAAETELLFEYSARAGTSKNMGEWLIDRSPVLSRYPEISSATVLNFNITERKLNGFLRAIMPHAGLHRLAVGVFQGDTRVFRFTRGLNLKTPRSLASVSKVFTAVAVLQLAERGKLSLDDNIVRFFPGLPMTRKPLQGIPITVRDLLRHSSGIPYRAIRGGRTYTTPFRKKRYFAAAQERPAGRVFHYSNYNYTMLAAVIERASNSSYPDYITRNILRPAKLDESRVYEFANGASGVISTVDDLHRFARHLFPSGERVALLSPASLRQMTARPPYVPAHPFGQYYGLGVKVRFRNNKMSEIFHLGMWERTSAGLHYFVRENSVLAYLGEPENFRTVPFQSYHRRTADMAYRYIKKLEAVFR